MSKAAELAKMGEVLTNSQIGGRRNLVINGAMNVAQRATSATGVGGTNEEYPTLDRFNFTTTSAGRFTMTQTADGPTGFANCMKLDCTTVDTSISASEALILQTKFEGQDVQQLMYGSSSAQPITVSFYVKGNASATYTLEWRNEEDGRNTGKTFNVTTDWTRVSITFAGDTAGTAVDDDNTHAFTLGIWLHGGTTFSGGTFAENTWHATHNLRIGDSQTSFFDSTDRTFFLTGLQLEVGSVATPFENRSFGEELALCQRYFHFSGFPKIIPGQDQDDGSLTDYEGQVFSWTLGDNRHATSYSFPTTMRSNPAIIMYGPVDGTSARSAKYNSPTQETVSAYYNESTNGLHGYFQGSSNSTGQRFFLGADCEL